MRHTFIIALIIGCSFMISAQDSSELVGPEAPKYYENAKVIRVKYAQGESFVERSQEDGQEELTENLAIFEGDTLRTEDGRVELYLGKLNHVRIDRQTELRIVKAPVLRGTEWDIELLSGSIILDLAELDADAQSSVQTLDCGVFFVTPGVFRIDAKNEGETTVWSLEGSVQVSGDSSQTQLSSQKNLVMSRGRLQKHPALFDEQVQDDFLAFHHERTEGSEISRSIGSTYLEKGFEDYESELTHNGRWQYNSAYSANVWYPYGLSSTWQPYVNGRWIWHAIYGYVWSSYDPCGWFTHHYGRWQWDAFDGWYWLPGYQWSPAWVSWGWDQGYYCWAPVDRRNRPVIVIKKSWIKDYRHDQGLPTRASSVAVVHRDNLRNGKIGTVVVRKIGSDLVEDRLRFRGAPPRINITDPVLRARTSSGRSILIKRSGINHIIPESNVPVITPRREASGPSPDSLRSVQRVIREKVRDTTESGASERTERRSTESRVTQKSSSGPASKSSAGSSSSSDSGSRTVVKKKKGD